MRRSQLWGWNGWESREISKSQGKHMNKRGGGSSLTSLSISNSSTGSVTGLSPPPGWRRRHSDSWQSRSSRCASGSSGPRQRPTAERVQVGWEDGDGLGGGGERLRKVSRVFRRLQSFLHLLSFLESVTRECGERPCEENSGWSEKFFWENHFFPPPWIRSLKEAFRKKFWKATI